MPGQTIHTTYDHAEFQQLIIKAVEDTLRNVLGVLTPNNEPAKEILTRKETAKMLGISLTTLYNYTKQGVIRSCTVGYSVRYRLADIEDAMNNKTLSQGDKFAKGATGY